MKLLRETIRKIILENNQNARYEKLFTMLDSYDLANVQQGIELATILGFAEVSRHIVHKGLSPSAQRRGEKGIGRCHHVFTLKVEPDFMKYMGTMFDEYGNKSPNENIIGNDFHFRNLGPQTIEVFAEDENQMWSDVCEEWNDRSVLEVEMPV